MFGCRLKGVTAAACDYSVKMKIINVLLRALKRECKTLTKQCIYDKIIQRNMSLGVWFIILFGCKFAVSQTEIRHKYLRAQKRTSKCASLSAFFY